MAAGTPASLSRRRVRLEGSGLTGSLRAPASRSDNDLERSRTRTGSNGEGPSHDW